LTRRRAGAASSWASKPPPNYTCNRCDKPGHWKKDCPTLGDPAYDQKKFSVGIPVSRTRIISEEDAALSTEGVMRLPDGRYVQCMPSEYVRRIDSPPSLRSDEDARTHATTTPRLDRNPSSPCPLTSSLLRAAYAQSCRVCASSFGKACKCYFLLTRSDPGECIPEHSIQRLVSRVPGDSPVSRYGD